VLSRVARWPSFVEAVAAFLVALPGGFAGLGVLADFFFAMSTNLQSFCLQFYGSSDRVMD
jgi:hypothetical protein